ncbi:hypothetical protein OAG60_02475 [bacterium]|nr:hypothetical protein [bacterium]
MSNTTTSQQTKTCNECGVTKAITEFHKCGKKVDGSPKFQPACKPCRNAAIKKSREKGKANIRLTFIEELPNQDHIRPSVRKARFLCECGNEHIAGKDDVKRGSTSQCKECNANGTSERNTTHGLTDHPLYGTWSMMINRCYNPKADDYSHYGGQGIGVEPLWKDNPVMFAFYCERVLGPKPEGYTLDRINPYLGYTTGNLRWADATTQVVNQKVAWPLPVSVADDSAVFAKLAEYKRAGAESGRNV